MKGFFLNIYIYIFKENEGYKLHIYTGEDCILSTSFMEFDHWSFEGAKKLHGMRQKELHQNRFGIGMSIFVFSLP